MAHPPTPGPFVQPNSLPVMEAMGGVPFPISKRELIEEVGDRTVLIDGRNVSLHDLIKEIHDDYFETEAEFVAALEDQSWAVTETESLPPAGLESSDAPDLKREMTGLGDATGPVARVERSE